MSAYIRAAKHRTKTPQSQPIPGREAEMAPNAAGGVTFKVNDWERLERFLILGTDGGTYYASEQKLTLENAQVVLRCIAQDGERVVTQAYEVNLTNRAPKVGPQLYALALALKHGNAATKTAVSVVAPQVLRTGTHLLNFVAMLDGLGGLGRAKRRVIAEWFTKQDVEKLAYQVLKYKQRDGWAMRDLLRVSHPKFGDDVARHSIAKWVLGQEPEFDGAGLPHILRHASVMNDQAQHVMVARIAGLAGKADLVEVAQYGIDHGLPREALPTEALAFPEVWAGLVPQMPVHAVLRNLATMTASGVLGNDSPSALLNTVTVRNKLSDAETLKRARVHPFALLLASEVYKQGHGVRSAKTWVPVQGVLSALEDGYDAAFQNVTPTGKRILIAIDTSGSMSAACAGSPIGCSTAAAAMAITLARSEARSLVIQFDTQVRRAVPVTKRTGIASIETSGGGGTDISAPVTWAAGIDPRKRLYAYHRPDTHLPPQKSIWDAIVILTDNETWAGNVHTSQVMQAYRETVSPGCKLVVCAMAANSGTVADPTDPLSFGCAGLDANLPTLVSDFIGR